MGECTRCRIFALPSKTIVDDKNNWELKGTLKLPHNVRFAAIFEN